LRYIKELNSRDRELIRLYENYVKLLEEREKHERSYDFFKDSQWKETKGMEFLALRNISRRKTKEAFEKFIHFANETK
jgi:hypothetical protein